MRSTLLLLSAILYVSAGCRSDDAKEDTGADIDPCTSSTWYPDLDGDGYGDDDGAEERCEGGEGWVEVGGDCDDTDASVYPGADEYCNGIDNDCDGEIDNDAVDAQAWYEDADGDGYGNPDVSMVSCDPGPGWALDDTDCDDTDPRVHPGAAERCDGKDNDCNGLIDDNVQDTWYQDADGDGYGDPDLTLAYQGCDPPEGYAENADDCDDTNPDVHPGADEHCNGIDNDCDGVIDNDAVDAPTWYQDADGDGYGTPEVTVLDCDPGEGWAMDATDCDDTDATVYPGADEYCNGIDNDCDGEIDNDPVDATTWYEDGDGDGYGDDATAETACTAPSADHISVGGDCDDTNPEVNPGADEVCDGIDNNCDGQVDVGAIDGAYKFLDADGDGFGVPGTYDWRCEGAWNNADCDDTDPNEPQAVQASATASSADGSLSNPWTTIQEGIDNSNQCVVVYAGTYEENIDFGGKDITVTGVAGAATTIIDGSADSAPAVTFNSGETSSSILRGFTITGGGGYYDYFEDSYTCGSGSWTCYSYTTTWCGGGIYIDSASPTLDDLVITGNTLPEATTSTSGIIHYYYTYSYGGGICAQNTSMTIEDVEIAYNFADQGGGVWIDQDTSLDLSQVWLYSNSATDGGGVQVDGGDLTMTNVLSTWNEATDTGGGVLAVDATLTEINVTHGGESAPSGGGLYLSGTSTGSVMNTIIYLSLDGEGVLADSGATFSGLYNNVYNNASGEYSGFTNPTGSFGNISWSPSFTDVTNDGDPTNDDWSLTSGSLSEDAGNPASAYDDVDGTRNDMGAYGGPGGAW